MEGKRKREPSPPLSLSSARESCASLASLLSHSYDSTLSLCSGRPSPYRPGNRDFAALGFSTASTVANTAFAQPLALALDPDIALPRLPSTSASSACSYSSFGAVDSSGFAAKKPLNDSSVLVQDVDVTRSDCAASTPSYAQSGTAASARRDNESVLAQSDEIFAQQAGALLPEERKRQRHLERQRKQREARLKGKPHDPAAGANSAAAAEAPVVSAMSTIELLMPPPPPRSAAEMVARRAPLCLPRPSPPQRSTISPRLTALEPAPTPAPTPAPVAAAEKMLVSDQTPKPAPAPRCDDDKAQVLPPYCPASQGRSELLDAFAELLGTCA